MYDETTGRYVYPHQTEPGVFVSRQRLCQLRHVAEGLCAQCGRLRPETSTQHCVRCQRKYRKYMREYMRRRRAA